MKQGVPPARGGRSPWLLLAAVAVTIAVGVGAYVTRDDRAVQNAAVRPVKSSGPQYVAIGDSFTSGGHIGTLQPGGADCLRSSRNYPSLVAKDMGYALRDVSCFGASTKDVLEGDSPGVPAQVAALSDATKQVTVSIGGNDLGIFSTMFLTCVRISQPHSPGAPCRQQFEGRLAAKMLLVSQRVGAVLDKVKELAPNASVLVVNYLSLMPQNAPCASIPFADRDVLWFAGVEQRLSNAVQSAAEQRNLDVVDAHALSEDHGICSGPGAWVNGPRPKKLDGLLFHPNGVGERAIANAIVAHLREHKP
jgi:lysophospholipase L1-like esterase